MSFFGKVYKYEREENFDAFLGALSGIPKPMVDRFRNIKPNESLSKKADGTYTFTISTPEVQKSWTFTNGVEFEEEVQPEGIVLKNVFNVEGNTMTTSQTYPGGRAVYFIREFSDTELKATYSTNNWNGSAFRYYKA